MGKITRSLTNIPSGTAELLRELVSYLPQNRTQLREEWARRITEAKLLTAMSKEEIFAEATAVYDNYVEALESATFEALTAYARRLSERIIPRGVETHEVIGSCMDAKSTQKPNLAAHFQNHSSAAGRLPRAGKPSCGSP